MPRKRNIDELREKALKSAREGIKNAYASEEYALMQAINAYRETTRSYNLAFERLSEWYGIYFPEIKISNPDMLADLAIALNTKGSVSKESIMAAVKDQERADSIYAKATATIGRSMNDEEKAALMSYAGMCKRMSEALVGIEEYLKVASKRILPNTTYLTDEKIAAELLARAGSMERLALMPASTVQLLGAEKALFKHIKFGSKPPKYGTLFKLPRITAARRDLRGRYARAYAAKIAIALKADQFTKNFIAERLMADLEESLKRIDGSPVREKPQRGQGFGGRFQRRPQGQHRMQGRKFGQQRHERA